MKYFIDINLQIMINWHLTNYSLHPYAFKCVFITWTINTQGLINLFYISTFLIALFPKVTQKI